MCFLNESCVFSGKMRLAKNVIVNSYDTRATAPGCRVFLQLKRASRKPFQIPCVFSMIVCLAFKVIVNLYVMRSIAPTFLVFFRRTMRLAGILLQFVGFTLLAFSQVVRVLRSEVLVNLHVMRPTAP